MAKLSKLQRARHDEAEDLLKLDKLKDDQIDFVLTHWNPAATNEIGGIGAFFTPPDFASDFRIETHGDRIVDLCAGIGTLSLYATRWPYNRDDAPEVVCIEKNPRFVEIGKKLLPQATWICGNVFDLKTFDLGHFDNAIGNPPFGNVSRTGGTAPKGGPRYQGKEFEYHLIDLASDHAEYGTFIVPQSSAPFRFSGAQYFDWQKSTACQRFEQQTRIEAQAGCGIDTSVFRDQWQNTAITCEVVCIDFMEAREARKPQLLQSFAPQDKATQGEYRPAVQADLFAVA